jgi:hypothetical protein
MRTPPASHDTVRVDPLTVTVLAGNGNVAGPLRTEPSVAEKVEPWHGQTITPLSTPATVQPWWVQVELNALNEPAAGWVTTTAPMTFPPPTGTSAVDTVTGPV